MNGKNANNFFKEVARYGGWESPSVPAKAWTAFYEVMVRHLYQDQEVHIPGVGTLKCRQCEERMETRKLANGKEVDFFFPAKVVPYLIPADNFVDDINGTGVSSSYRHRLKAGVLTENDYKRMKRQELLDNEGRRVVTEDVRQDLQKHFLDGLRDKKAELDAKRKLQEEQKEKEKETQGNDKQTDK